MLTLAMAEKTPIFPKVRTVLCYLAPEAVLMSKTKICMSITEIMRMQMAAAIGCVRKDKSSSVELS